MRQYALLIRLHRPIGIYLLLWPTLWALWVAGGGKPDITVTLVFVAGVFFMRSAGCAINDYADRNIDHLVARTRDRPLATGKITPREALIVAVVMALLSLLLLLFLNGLTRWFAVGGALIAASYPFMKRFHYLPQVHLGVAFSWGIPMAFTAQTGELPTEAGWLLFIANILWTTAYDTQYAMADREDDLKVGVKSTAILFGDADRLILGVMHVLVLISLMFAGVKAEMGWLYYTGVVLSSGVFAYQHWLVRDRRPSACFSAFLNNNWFGLLVFLAIVFDFLVSR